MFVSFGGAPGSNVADSLDGTIHKVQGIQHNQAQKANFQLLHLAPNVGCIPGFILIEAV